MRKNIKRRGFIAGASVGMGLGIGYWSSSLLEEIGANPEAGWKVFTEEEAAEVDRLAEELIPADTPSSTQGGRELFGGAHEAHVVRFLDWNLAQGEGLEQTLSLYRKHLPLIKGMTAAEVEKTYPNFFKQFLNHVNMGFYGNPRYGGNDHYVSTHMLGIAGPSCTGREVPL